MTLFLNKGQLQTAPWHFGNHKRIALRGELGEDPYLMQRRSINRGYSDRYCTSAPFPSAWRPRAGELTSSHVRSIEQAVDSPGRGHQAGGNSADTLMATAAYVHCLH